MASEEVADQLKYLGSIFSRRWNLFYYIMGFGNGVTASTGIALVLNISYVGQPNGC